MTLRMPIMRVGLPEVTGSLPLAAERLGVPVLVSASRLWDAKRQRFREPGRVTWDLDIALDSAGFTAMKTWGGCYPWSTQAYAELGVSHSWRFWSQPDLCCEPEIAASPAEVDRRVGRSAELLAETTEIAEGLIQRLCLDLALNHGASEYTGCLKRMNRPMPILQGWHPADYIDSIRRIDGVLGGNWPALVGIGSVCRRHLRGEAGLIAILKAIDAHLPPHVTTHLFGVKGSALPALWPWLHRIASLDSMAWDFAARRSQNDRPESMRPIDWRAQVMAEWVERQRVRIAQLHRNAHAEDHLQRIINTLRDQLPPGLTATDLDRFLAHNTEGLHRQLLEVQP